MTPIQQLMLGVGASKKTYLDDVFSNYLYAGQSSTKTITNGIDNLGKGGMLWVKNRDNARGHQLYDTERLASGSTTTSDYSVTSDSNGAARDMSPNGIVTWKNDGWSVPGGDGDINQNGFGDYTSWNFRKAPGFFTIKEYSGSGSTQNISHDLGSIPGLIMIKRTDSAASWRVYHRGIGATKGLKLNASDAEVTSSGYWNDTLPTSTHFTVKDSGETNAGGATYIAYLFAGGESTAATARSVDFDGTGDYLTTNTSSDYTLGTGDFTLEYWYKPDTVNYSTFLVDANTGSEVWATYCNTNGQHKYRVNGTDEIVSDTALRYGQWHHIAIVRASGTTKMYVNGVKEGSDMSDSTDYSFTSIVIGRRASSGDLQYDGEISNLRLVKGTAVYTSSFRPTYEPLTSISNTSLLCCNNSSVTGATTGTLTSSGDPTASTDSPFDDPAGFVFGDAGDQNVIKTGSYVGNGSSTGPEINLGWEAQYILIKNRDNSADWVVVDSMRGIVTSGDDDDKMLQPNLSATEFNGNFVNLTSTGFKILDANAMVNTNGASYIYMAIRRSDGYVGKPPELGTDVFAMDAGAGSSTIPNFDSGFPVDFAFIKTIAGSNSWTTSARLIQGKYLYTNTNDAESAWDKMVFDSNTGWNNHSSYGSGDQSWMWKRHAGFDVVCYEGHSNSQAITINHSLNKIPEMMLIKQRTDAGYSWIVYHKGLNGGTNPHQYFMMLNSTDAEASSTFLPSAPTSTSIRLSGSAAAVNNANKNYLMMLFASVDGISKVGSYTGTGADLTITLGFQPRFVLIKDADNTASWHLFDTVRGIASGNDKVLLLNDTDAQINEDRIDLTSDGMTLHGMGSTNENNMNFIYYAHA